MFHGRRRMLPTFIDLSKRYANLIENHLWAQAMIPDQMLDYFVVEGEKWILEQRRLHHPTAKPFSPDQRSKFEAFFSRTILDAVRFAVVEQIPNPGFYKNLQAMGQPIPMDFGADPRNYVY